MALLNRIPALVAAALVVTLGGCYEEQSPECQRYVECFDAFNAATGEGDQTLVATFRFDGACWNSPTTADECTEICAYDINCLRGEFEERELDIPAACPVGVTDVDNAPVVAQCAP